MELAADEVLLEQFEEMVERRALGETQACDRTAPESSANRGSFADTAEQRDWQARIEAQVPRSTRVARSPTATAPGSRKHTLGSRTHPPVGHPGSGWRISSAIAPT